MDIIEIFNLFPTQSDCIAYLEKVRWQGEPRCPYCKSTKQSPLRKEHRYHCNNCNTSFSVTVGTIFHKTHMPLQKWLLAVSLILDVKKGISSRQLARHLKVHRNTAWRTGMKIREAMIEPEQRNMLCGIVEMDETYIGGKARRSRKDGNIDHRKHPKGGWRFNKTPVVGMIERHGNVKAKVVKKTGVKFKKLANLVRENIDRKHSILVTDHARWYRGMHRLIRHASVDHSMWYVDGWKHTNTIECFWALLKRGIVGQFHKVSVRHLHRYITEFSYRFNNRHNTEVFDLTIRKGLGVS